MYFFIPFVIQAIVIFIDEFYFHIKRGLPLWERIGHPIDTLSVSACLLFALYFPFSQGKLIIYIILATLSCILVTKDEFVHKEHCPAKEQWLHALLFINHPLVMISTAFLWAGGHTLFLTIQFCVSIFFALYQVIYWNFIWKKS